MATVLEFQLQYQLFQDDDDDAKSCLTLCNPLDYSPAGSSVHGILQARILEWVAMRDLPNPGIEPMSLKSPALSGSFFATSATWKAPLITLKTQKCPYFWLARITVENTYREM